MSIDTVDLLHAAEDRVCQLEALLQYAVDGAIGWRREARAALADPYCRGCEDAEECASTRHIIDAVELIDSLDRQLWYDLATKLTRTELEAFCDLLLALGRREDALAMLERWVEGEIEDREIEPGDIEVDEHLVKLIDNREDG